MVLAVLFLLNARSAGSVADEAQAIEKIQVLGGRVTRDRKAPDHPVIEVELNASQRFNDNYLHLLKSFPKLTRLRISEIAISDAGFVEIAGSKDVAHARLACHADDGCWIGGSSQP